MSNESIRQLSNSGYDIGKTHVRYVVKDKVKAQVVDSNSGKIIREIPRKLSADIFKSLYA